MVYLKVIQHQHFNMQISQKKLVVIQNNESKKKSVITVQMTE